MQQGTAASLLAKSPLFRGLDDQWITRIADRCELVAYDTGQIMCAGGAPADAAFLVIEGDVSLLGQDGQSIDKSVTTGAILDEMAMFVDTDHAFGAVAATQVWALALSRETISQLILEFPGLAAHFAHATRLKLARVADTLRQVDSMLLDSEKKIDAIPATEILNAPAVQGEIGVAAERSTPQNILSATAEKVPAGVNGNGSSEADRPQAAAPTDAPDLLAELQAALRPAPQN